MVTVHGDLVTALIRIKDLVRMGKEKKLALEMMVIHMERLG